MRQTLKGYRWWLSFFSLLLALSVNVDAQTKKKSVQIPAPKTEAPKNKKPVNIAEDEKRVKDIIDFLQYLLNTLGSSSTSTRDKEVMAKESYSKIFKDGKVQIEDDLDAERVVVTNKDVVPYLKDVDFFFENVKFEFTIEDIKSSTLPNGEIFYKVSTRRILTGTTTEGMKVSNTIPRYIEVNYNATDQDLKIASIYTHELNQTEALTNWWKALSLGWKSVLTKKLPLANLVDSIQIDDIKLITSIEELDLSNNTTIQNIEPLDRLPNLKTLNLSGATIDDLTPLRNLTELETLDISYTEVNDISPLKYANKLVHFNMSHTNVTDISTMEKMTSLKDVNLSETKILDFSPLAFLTVLEHADLSRTKITHLMSFENLLNLSELNVSATSIIDLSPLKNQKHLKQLKIDSTYVSNVQVLEGMEDLEELHANYTSVANLIPLVKLAHLKKVYVDHTRVDKMEADKFHFINPKVQIIFASDDLKTWWAALPSDWQEAFSKSAHVSLSPTKEEMAKVSQVDSINIGGNKQVKDLEPLRNLQKLQIIIANNTGIQDLSPLEAHTEIRQLDISGTEVRDISLITSFANLKILKADDSKIENLESYALPSLEKVYADHSLLHDISAREFLEKNPKCLVIYKSSHLTRWWNDLPENWKDVFNVYIGTDTTRETLHKLIELEALQFNDAPVNSLDVLNEFIRLKKLHFSGTSITQLPGLENLKSLTSLHATNSPIRKIESIHLLTSLTDLDVSNTPIEDLDALENLSELKNLNCSGTQIKRLDPLQKLSRLQHVDCSNTSVKKLDPLQHLQLKTLTCYNTRVSNRRIEEFKEKNPECNVVYYR